MNFCKDCRHFLEIEPSIPICCHPDSPRDKVWGIHASCITLRESRYPGFKYPTCGPDGEWFEQKQEA